MTKKETLQWRVNTGQLLREMVENNPTAWTLRQPVNILIGILESVARRAIELDDPALNILMLRLALYEVPAVHITASIDRQQARIQQEGNT